MPAQGDILLASGIQALQDIQEELFRLNRNLERIATAVVSVEEALGCTDSEEQSVKEVNAKIKNFFNKTGSA